jgi:UDP-N-acetylmuramate dehydrogenase
VVSADVARAIEQVAAALGPAARRDQPLGELTTYGVGGRAALFVELGSEEEVSALRAALGGRAVPVLVVGRGSNLLVADQGFPGVAVRLAGDFARLTLPGPPRPADGAGASVLRAGGALALPVLARRSVEAGLAGLEWAVGVPGSVGGAVRMNAGGHGSDMAACLVRYRWVDLCGDEGGEDAGGRLAFAYRRSSVRDQDLVVWADLAVHRGEPAQSRSLLAEIVRWRREHQPGGANAGSVFTNPPGSSAGQLIDEAGLKGLRVGTASVSTKHANFIQADRGGRADDVARLIERVRAEVARRRGVQLETEVRLVGFASDPLGGGAAAAHGVLA